MNVSLREYQLHGVEAIIDSWQEYRSVLFQMPTGTGKTTLFCEIVRKYTTEISPEKKVLVITHRKELVEQVFNRLSHDFHLPAGIISGSFFASPSSSVQVASIQTLIRRKEQHNDIYSVVIIDEAHHALASTYKKLWQFFPSAKFLGVTATPVRTNGEGFYDLFEKLITTASIKWFIKNKYLSDVRYFASHTPDIGNIKMKAGDYDEAELSEIMQDKNVMADLFQSYVDFAEGKKMIVFAVNRAHSKKIVEKFISNGYNAKAIDTFTSSEERRSIVQDFRENKIKILCNVNIFTEGFDCPDVDVVQLARPTKSLTLFLQQVGRCMRPFHNKEFGIVLDNAGLWKEHGLPKMDRLWTLEGSNGTENSSIRNILGIREGNAEVSKKEIHETKAMRLVEIGEIESIDSSSTIPFSKIESSLTDKKILTMRERSEYLTKQIIKLQEKLSSEDDEDIKDIIQEKIIILQQELAGLHNELRPKRFEQVLEQLISKCQEIIDNNEIFVEGDKDLFLKRFVEPALDDKSISTFREGVKHFRTQTFSLPLNSEKRQVTVYHTFPSNNHTAQAIYVPAINKIIYNGESFSPSSAAIFVNKEITGKVTSLNGLLFWKFKDETGELTPIGYLRKYIQPTLEADGPVKVDNARIATSTGNIEVAEQASCTFNNRNYILKRFENKTIRVFDENDNPVDLPVLPFLKNINNSYNLGVEEIHSTGTPKNTQVFGKDVIQALNKGLG